MRGLAQLRGRREPGPIPVEIADAVELWARGSGRHATIVWIDAVTPPIAQVRITLRANDPRLEAWREGLTDEEPVETVELVEWDERKNAYVGIPLSDLGATGVTEMLQKGDTWSGSGEFDSLQEAIVAARERKKAETERLRQFHRGEALSRLEETSRYHLDIPQVPGADVTKEQENDAGK